jgi:cell division protease FtsH
VKARLRKRPWLLAPALVVVVLIAAAVWSRQGDDPLELNLGEFQEKAAAGEIAEATIKDRDNSVTGELSDGTRFRVSYPAEFSPEITRTLLDADVPAETDSQHDALWVTLLLQLLPLFLLVGVLLYFLSGMQGGGRFAGFGKTKARRLAKDQPQVTFADVAGCDEAIEELREIRDFLEDPGRFQAMGAKIPKGVLLYGPPGTGKTLLARAVAGEAGVPFFSISGSDFVEMFVGVGASRVRDLFNQAKQSAPAIVFVDEIDAVGRHRGAGTGGGHDEREQTLNQMLVEMDGFDVASGVILVAATNRPDILDPALLRPGRFDRQIVVDRPDLEGRKAILAVHGRGKPMADDVDLEVIARRTPGFTGADLANTVNEAAILSTRRGNEQVHMAEFEEAIDRVIAGPERKTRVMSEREKLTIAYHEGGHALVGHVLPNTDPIHKVSIIARGRALGWTLALPTEDKNIKSRSELRDEMAMLMGGRTAEELIFGDPTTGAMNDIERATQIARAMVTQYGMSDVLGPQQFGSARGEPFAGKDQPHDTNYSDETAAGIDAEVRRLLDEAHDEALELLSLHRPALDHLAEALVAHETLGDAELQPIWDELDLPGRHQRGGNRSSPVERPEAPGRSEQVTAAEAEALPNDGSEKGPPRFREG